MAKKEFAETLKQLRYGTLHDELTDALAEAVEAATRTGKKAKLAVVLTLNPMRSGQVEITDDLKLTLPEEQKGSTIMFATPENNLSRDDPRQGQIEGLRTIDAEEREMRTIDSEDVVTRLKVVG